jgi:NAD-dependent SIR2 family protein deacetylase
MSSVLELAALIRKAGTVTVLTGAGVSTGSGIPGYRDREGNWQHPPPVQFADFVGRDAVRRRYWARSFAGWGRIAEAEPNAAHRSLRALEQAGVVDTLVSQNVDGLHQRAGSRRVVDLHGRLDSVVCLDCRTSLERPQWQDRLLAANPGFHARVTRINPDGDAELADQDVGHFTVPECSACGGIMKPDVVFFGEAVPGERVARAMSSVERSGALLVVGSSLMVFSGLRFVRQAVELGKPVAILNQGRTRADEVAALRIDAECGQLLQELAGLIRGAEPVVQITR